MAGRFGDVITAMVTPFKDDFRLDLDGAQELAKYLLDHGSDALVVAGTTGEGPALSHKEKEDLFTKLKKNDEVLTAAGIIGIVAMIKDNDEVVLKVDESSNVRLRVTRSSITRVS